jgi:hypothetical protein
LGKAGFSGSGNLLFDHPGVGGFLYYPVYLLTDPYMEIHGVY